MRHPDSGRRCGLPVLRSGTGRRAADLSAPAGGPQYNAGPSLVSQVYGKPKSKLEKLLILFSMIFFVLAALALLISLIRGIVDATDPFLGGFGTFLDVFFGGIYRAAIYSFMALALAVFKNRLK